MPPLPVSKWRKLPLSLTELCIDTTLRCGQSFRWQKINDEWNCVLHGRLLSLKQDESFLHYKVIWPTSSLDSRKPVAFLKETEEKDAHQVDDTEALLRHYFNLRYDLSALYDQWSESDPNFRKKAPRFTGIRILCQDAWEALVAFICSSNNNISRISQMVHKLCVHYGPLIVHIGDEAFHDFPSPAALAEKKVEAHLRELGFGYRAKYIVQTAMALSMEKPEGWLEGLTNPENPGWVRVSTPDMDKPITYRQAHEQLLLLSGVGPKVADCVCLMGLGWGEAVPVDTHVLQIAQRDYHFGKTKTKTFSKAVYDSIGDHFRHIWGPKAGWAQSVLFTANLKSFSDHATTDSKSVDIKVESEEIIAQPSSKTRKRQIVTAVAEQVKLEEDESLDIKPIGKKRKRVRR